MDKGKFLKFEKQLNKVSTVEVHTTSWIGRGRYADVVRALLTVHYDGDDERVVTLAFKQYKEDRDDVDEDFLTNLLKTYNKSRESGLPVLPTFRINYRKLTVATTDWTEGRKYDVGGYGNIHESEGTEKIRSILNLEKLVEQISDTAIKAGQNELEVASDAYFFRFLRTGGDVQVDYVIGDIDGIIDPPISSSDSTELSLYNLESAQYALHWWLHNNLSHDKKTQKLSLNLVKSVFDSKKEQIRLTTSNP